MVKDRQPAPWSGLLDAGRADGRLVREAREGPGAAALVDPPEGLHPEVLAALEVRLGNDAAAELEVAGDQLRQIALLRLQAALAA